MGRVVRIFVAAAVAVAVLAPPGPASAQPVIWMHQFGTQFPDDAEGVAVHPTGGTWVAGQTFGILPGQTPAGMIDAFLRRYDARGNELWTRQFGSTERDFARSVAVDIHGHAYVAGQTFGTFPGQASGGGYDAFVRKYTPDGHEMWTRQFGTPAADGANGVAVDRSGHAYVAGSTRGTLTGDDKSSIGDYDAFVRKYTPDGNEVWTRQFGSPADDFAIAVAVDPGGGAVVVGETAGALPRHGSSGGTDAFVVRFDAAGNQVWSRQFGSSANDRAGDVAIDTAGNAYVVGRVDRALPNSASAGDSDAFLRKYDPGGSLLWSVQFGTPRYDDAGGVAVDDTGNVYVAGRTDGAMPGQRSAGGIDAYVRKYTSSGRDLWVHQFGSPSVDYALAVAVDGTGNPYVVGGTTGSLPGQTSAGDRDAFVLRLG